MTAEVAIGARVRVIGVDGNDLGLGTYLGDVAFDDAGNEIPVPENPDFLEDNPKIQLDSGNIIYGFECWWSEIDETIEAAISNIEALAAGAAEKSP